MLSQSAFKLLKDSNQTVCGFLAILKRRTIGNPNKMNESAAKSAAHPRVKPRSVAGHKYECVHHATQEVVRPVPTTPTRDRTRPNITTFRKLSRL